MAGSSPSGSAGWTRTWRSFSFPVGGCAKRTRTVSTRSRSAAASSSRSVPATSTPRSRTPWSRKWGPRHGPPSPPTLGAPRRSRGAPRYSDRLLDPLDDGGDPLAEANAHGLEPIARAAPLELVEQRRHELRARAAERVAERDRAAVDVHTAHVRVKLPLPREHDRSERLVDLDEVDVVQGERGPLQHALGRRDRTGQHDRRVHAGERRRDHARAGPDAERLRSLGRHEHERRGAVGDLRGVGGGHHTVGLEGRRQRRYFFAVDGHADALVGVEDGAVWERHRPDLALEPPLGDRASGLLVALRRELVELLALEPPRLGDQLRGNPLGHDVVALLQPGRERRSEERRVGKEGRSRWWPYH